MTHITVDTARTGPLVERLRGVFDHLQVCGFPAGGIPDLMTQKGNCLLYDLAALLSLEGGEQAAESAGKYATREVGRGPEDVGRLSDVAPPPTPPDTRSPGQRARDEWWERKNPLSSRKTPWELLPKEAHNWWKHIATMDATQPPQPPAKAGLGAGEADGCGETLEGLRERVEALERQVHELTRTEDPVAVLARVRALGEGL